MRDVLELQPYADCHSQVLLDHTTQALGLLRGFHLLPGDSGPYFGGDPALRLHLLVSVFQQLQADILTAVLGAHDQGYTPHQLAVLLDRPA